MLGVINLWEVPQLTSRVLPLPPFFFSCFFSFFWPSSFNPEIHCLQRQHKQAEKTKDQGEKQPTELFAWLVNLRQTHGHNDHCLRPLDLPKQQDAGPFLVSAVVVVGRFL